MSKRHSMSRSTIEREARAAAAARTPINDACPYPFGSDEANHFKAVYLLALDHPFPNDQQERTNAL